MGSRSSSPARFVSVIYRPAYGVSWSDSNVGARWMARTEAMVIASLCFSATAGQTRTESCRVIDGIQKEDLRLLEYYLFTECSPRVDDDGDGQTPRFGRKVDLLQIGFWDRSVG